MKLDLTDRQMQTVRAAITILATFVIVCAVALLLWLLGSFVARFSNVFLPLAVAAIAAFVMQPYFELLRRRLRLPKVLALIAVFLSILVPLVAFGWFFGALVVEQLVGLARTAPETWTKMVEWAREHWPNAVSFLESNEAGQRVRDVLEGKEEAIARGVQSGLDVALNAGGVVLRWFGTIVAWAVLPVYFAFFLMTNPSKVLEIDHLLPFLKPETRQNVVYLVREFVNILVAFFRGQIIVAFLQGALFAVGFSIVGLRYGLVLGLALGFLNIIPYLGNMVGLGIAIPLALFQEGGGGLLLVLVLGVFTLVQMIEGYILTPRIMGDRTGLHPMVIIIAIFFWGSALGGISGMILAIPLTAFLVVFWRLAKDRYIDEWV